MCVCVCVIISHNRRLQRCFYCSSEQRRVSNRRVIINEKDCRRKKIEMEHDRLQNITSLPILGVAAGFEAQTSAKRTREKETRLKAKH